MMKLMRGGRNARREAKIMVSEKIRAAFESSSRLAAGASGDEIIHPYRQLVALRDGWERLIRAEVESAFSMSSTCSSSRCSVL
jgi:hypothetical protein